MRARYLDGEKQSLTSDKTLILSIHTNYPAFLESQLKLCRKHVKINYDFAVGWDEPQSSDRSLGLSNSSVIAEELAIANGASFHMVPSWVHTERNRLFFRSDLRTANVSDYAMRCANSLNYMLGLISWRKYKQVLVLDADMFPIHDLETSPVDAQRPIAGVRQLSGKKKDYEYFWNGLFWIYGDAPFSNLINFDIVKFRGIKTDVGGATNQYIQLCRHLGLDPVFLNHLASLSWGEQQLGDLKLEKPLQNWLSFDYRNGEGFFAEIYDETFLHYRGGGNWMNRNSAVELANRDALVAALL